MNEWVVPANGGGEPRLFLPQAYPRPSYWESQSRERCTTRTGNRGAVRDPKNRRLHGLSGLALNAERTDGYQGVIAWGGAPRQQGDLNYVLATGRAAREVFPALQRWPGRAHHRHGL